MAPAMQTWTQAGSSQWRQFTEKVRGPFSSTILRDSGRGWTFLKALMAFFERGMLDYAADLAQAAADTDLFFLVNTFHSFFPSVKNGRFKISADRSSLEL